MAYGEFPLNRWDPLLAQPPVRFRRHAPRPLNEIKLPPEALPPGVAAVRQTTFADPAGNEFDLVTWQPA